MTEAAFKNLEKRLENLERKLAIVNASGSRTNTKKKSNLNDTRERFAKAYINKKAG